VVSNEEIKRMLDAKRKGIKIDNVQNISGKGKICPQCKTKNPQNAIFCVNCGCKLDKNLNIKCPSCGTENTNNAKFCVGCGEKINQETIKEEPKKIKPKLQPTEDLARNDVEFLEAKKESESMDKSSETKDKSDIKPSIPSNIPEKDIITKNDSKKVCPSCHGKNLKTAKFCVVCGKNFAKEDKTPETIKETDTPHEVTPEIKVPQSILDVKRNINQGESDNKAELTSNTAEETEYVDPVDKIKKSKELLDMGAITSEEFENIKRKYLEQI
jgi:hypothetical protein